MPNELATFGKQQSLNFVFAIIRNIFNDYHVYIWHKEDTGKHFVNCCMMRIQNSNFEDVVKGFLQATDEELELLMRKATVLSKEDHGFLCSLRDFDPMLNFRSDAYSTGA